MVIVAKIWDSPRHKLKGWIMLAWVPVSRKLLEVIFPSMHTEYSRSSFLGYFSSRSATFFAQDCKSLSNSSDESHILRIRPQNRQRGTFFHSEPFVCWCNCQGCASKTGVLSLVASNTGEKFLRASCILVIIHQWFRDTKTAHYRFSSRQGNAILIVENLPDP